MWYLVAIHTLLFQTVTVTVEEYDYRTHVTQVLLQANADEYDIFKPIYN